MSMTDQDVTVQFNPMDVSLGDIEDLEQGFGVKFGALLASFRSKGEVDLSDLDYKTLAAMVFLIKRRENPDFQVGDVRALKFGDLMEVMSDIVTTTDDVEDPTPAG